jgi:predicted PilT family ATPase
MLASLCRVGELYCPAQEALFSVLEKLYEEFTDSSEEVQVRILIDRSQTGGVIGKDGKIIKELRDTSGANIKIFNSSGKPACASQYEDLLQVPPPVNLRLDPVDSGKPAGLCKPSG